MDIQFGKGTTQYGPGVEINLTGDEVATAISAYLTSHNIYIDGSRTIYVNGKLCKNGEIYVDPSGTAIVNGIRWSGRGEKVSERE